MTAMTAVARRGVLAALLILALAGCRAGGAGAGQSAADTPTADTPTAARDRLDITVTPALLEQIKIGEPAWAEVADKMSVPGRVEVDDTRVARVGSPVTGRITGLTAVVGQDVKRGQVLATLHSQELSDAQLAFLKALSQQQLAQRAATRAQELLQAEVIAVAETQRRQADLAQASAALSSARDQLVVLGMGKDETTRLEATREVDSQSKIVASIDGTVLERYVTLGQVVQPADTVFVVADLSRLWLVADVPEQAAGEIRVGKAVEAAISAFPNEVVKGKLSFVSATINPETRTVRIRMDLPNPARAGSDRQYKPAMLASMVLQGRAERRLVVPGTAVVREGNLDYVFVQLGPAVFRARDVTLGAEVGDRRVLLGGLSERERIVIDGAFHLNNERKKSALDAY